MVTADDKTVIGLSLSAGNCHDAPEGRELIKSLRKPENTVPLLMDKAYEGDETRKTVANQGFEPVVPPKSNRKDPWEYDKELYKRRNIVERFFRRIKGFRRINTRYDKLDTVFLAFLFLAIIYIALHNSCRHALREKKNSNNVEVIPIPLLCGARPSWSFPL